MGCVREEPGERDMEACSSNSWEPLSRELAASDVFEWQDSMVAISGEGRRRRLEEETLYLSDWLRGAPYPDLEDGPTVRRILEQCRRVYGDPSAYLRTRRMPKGVFWTLYVRLQDGNLSSEGPLEIYEPIEGAAAARALLSCRKVLASLSQGAGEISEITCEEP